MYSKIYSYYPFKRTDFTGSNIFLLSWSYWFILVILIQLKRDVVDLWYTSMSSRCFFSIFCGFFVIFVWCKKSNEFNSDNNIRFVVYSKIKKCIYLPPLPSSCTYPAKWMYWIQAYYQYIAVLSLHNCLIIIRFSALLAGFILINLRQLLDLSWEL